MHDILVRTILPPHEPNSQSLVSRLQRARPHPGPLPQERVNCSQMEYPAPPELGKISCIRVLQILRSAGASPAAIPPKTAKNQVWHPKPFDFNGVVPKA